MKKCLGLLFSVFFLISTFSHAEINDVRNQQDLIGIIQIPGEYENEIITKSSRSQVPYLLVLQQKGGFVGYFNFSYSLYENGSLKRYDFRTPDMTVGFIHDYKIPGLAIDVQVSGSYYTGLFWAPVVTIFNTSIKTTDYFNGHAIVSMWGSIWGQYWDVVIKDM